MLALGIFLLGFVAGVLTMAAILPTQQEQRNRGTWPDIGPY